MKFNLPLCLALVGILSINTAFARTQIPAEDVLNSIILKDTDNGFGGFYLDIEKAMETLDISRLDATEIQNQMRDELEVNAGSPSMVAQRPYLKTALVNAIDSVLNRKKTESGFKPMTFQKGDFLVVFDLDETLLTHWYKSGTGEGPARLGSLFPPERDVVPVYVDASGNSLPQPMLRMSPAAVQLRPGIESMGKAISEAPGFRGFVLFTAKDDRAATALIRYWRQAQPSFFKHVVGVFARNHLTFKAGLTKASKDLRIFDAELKHVVLIDDNESRVLQKDLCYHIPKFNADAYLDSLYVERDKRVSKAHGRMLPYVAEQISGCAKSAASAENEDTFSNCFRSSLGQVGEAGAELHRFQSMLEAEGFNFTGIDLHKAFEQPFVFEMERPLSGEFQRYSAGRLVDFAF